MRLPARLVSIHGHQTVQVLNVSQRGVMLRWSKPLRVGSDVLFAWSDFELFGQVVWAGGNHGGIAVDKPIPEALLLSMRAVEPEIVKDNDSPMWALRNFRRSEGRY